MKGTTAFDIQSLAALKREARASTGGALQAAARQMEGLFVQMMLKSMRDATPQDGLLDSSQSRMFTSMYDQQISQEIAARGLGLADIMVKQFGGETAPAPAQSAGTTPETPLTLSQEAINNMPQQALRQAVRRAIPSLEQEALPERPTGPVLNNANFISRLSAPAQQAARKSGLPVQLIMAQAALESGWGKREIRTEDGGPSHNLFGVKATGNWKGRTTEITTTEYVNGIAQKVKAKFRVYDSYAHALSDYATLLTKNPRYQKVVDAQTPEHAAKALQAAGYATDPKYAQKLISIIQNVNGSLNQAVKAYQTDLSSIF
ncbi:flagellar assembly peptidoglycan hydrolase FlgJ [Enterobacteriaceae bacterium YMB-R22]|uniref:flagellar assembly peptidoglycan hydrolase FlgJ n=1 Tax=Tenebrionicola larvae TaxID=2815733 RepID=UPI0020132C9F|nr:flagellar assembly peptidoglycan hydrolase FlgJ [Tenebrionicola larvae]MBV4413977.1 flagellar assembly peptidoglycan hydrolase FlgJ [Tenebrionicola larvae]